MSVDKKYNLKGGISFFKTVITLTLISHITTDQYSNLLNIIVYKVFWVKINRVKRVIK